jgi:hypothetical protein
VRRLPSLAVLALVATTFAGFPSGLTSAGATTSGPDPQIVPAGGIKHVMLIDLENESFSSTFGDSSSYLNQVLVPQGELVKNYYATGHVSLDNYVAQVSGQAPNLVSNSDCIGRTGGGTFNDVLPGTLDLNQAAYPGQVDGQGCVYPAAVQTIGSQLDAAYPSTTDHNWRAYAEDMGNDPVRDGGTPDPLGGTDCAHPQQASGAAVDDTNSASATDQYATRHNGFMYFHSVIDNQAACNQNVVPLGGVTVGTGGNPDAFTGHLAQDLASETTTPRFSFVSPNLCNDGHDSPCVGTNVEGTQSGGLPAVNIWLQHWMPMILNSPAYQSGSMLVVITADEGGIIDFRSGDNETPGPNNANPGYSPILNAPVPQFGNRTYYQILGFNGLTPGVTPTSPTGTMTGGGQIGALLLNPRYLHTGITDMQGSYNHYSALRTYEDLLGIQTGGDDGNGHLGFAATATPFGLDVFKDTVAPALNLPADITTAPTSIAGAPVSYTVSATDDVDGTDPVTCVAPSGSTFGFGTTAVNCSATDAAGNTATGSFNVTVTPLTFSGFSQPVDNAPIVNTVKGGATVAVKWSLNASGNEVSSLSAVAAGYPRATRVDCASGATYDAIEATTTGNTSLRYDTTAHQYVYNWKTPAQPGTCWRLDIGLVDNTSPGANFMMK